MQTILSMVQKITVFMMVAALFTNLFSGTEYKKYFQYAAGLIVIALALSPALSLLGGKEDVGVWLQRAVSEQRAEQTEQDIRMFGRKYEEAIEKRYEEQVREDVAARCGARAENCDVEVSEGRLRRITVRFSERPDNVRSLLSELAARYGISSDDIFIIEQ